MPAEAMVERYLPDVPLIPLHHPADGPPPPENGGRTFAATVAIDWSGAKGRRHKGIAVAEARGDEAPRLVRPDQIWSRADVLDWLVERAVLEPTLFGFDFSFAPPYVERGAYLPGEAAVPNEARAFWAYVDDLAPDEDLGAASFLEQVHRKHFYFGIADGVKADFVFLPCDRRSTPPGDARPPSAYDGSARPKSPVQLFRDASVSPISTAESAIWPMDPLQRGASAVFELTRPPLYPQRRLPATNPHCRRLDLALSASARNLADSAMTDRSHSDGWYIGGERPPSPIPRLPRRLLSGPHCPHRGLDLRVT